MEEDEIRPIRDFNIVIASSCPQEIEVCVRTTDSECEYSDNAEINVTVNRNIILYGDTLYRYRDQWSCNFAAVQAGRHTIEVYAGSYNTSYGACANKDVIIGEIRISGRGGNAQTQAWQYRQGSGTGALLDVTIGTSIGSCNFSHTEN